MHHTVTVTLNAEQQQPSPSSGSSAATQWPWPSPLTPQYYLGEMATPEEIAVIVMAEDFTAALRDLVPSVSQAEMAKYAQIRQRFSLSVNTVSHVDADGGADDQGSNIDTKRKGKGRDDRWHE
jgi:hypothetical protein